MNHKQYVIFGIGKHTRDPLFFQSSHIDSTGTDKLQKAKRYDTLEEAEADLPQAQKVLHNVHIMLDFGAALESENERPADKVAIDNTPQSPPPRDDFDVMGMVKQVEEIGRRKGIYPYAQKKARTRLRGGDNVPSSLRGGHNVLKK